MAKTKFGVFSLSQFPDLTKVVESFDDDLGFFELAEKLGYDKVWIAEHLFSTYGLVTSTQVYAAAIAQRTSKIRIGMAVCAIPFNHPLRTASDFALVDILSHGRLDFGVGRAYQPHEFVGLGVPMDKSREMLAEGLDIVLKSWTQEKISYQGKFWTIPEPVELLPKPVQKPHPPVYQATISPESFEQAAHLRGEMGRGRQHQLSLRLQRPAGEQGFERDRVGVRAQEDPQHRARSESR